MGAGIARGLAAAGARVVVNYSSSREAADRVVADIVKNDGKAIAVQADVAKADDVKRLFAATKARVASVRDALYLAVQLAARDFVAGVTLDELCSKGATR